MFFIEDNNFLTDEHKQCIEAVQSPDGIPYFYQQSFSRMHYKPFTHTLLCHILIHRPEHQADDLQVKNYYNSDYAKIFEDMLFTFCNNNQIICTEVIRAAINLTYNNGQEKCFPHVDHPEEYHKQLIIYLNDPPDKESHTVIMDKDTSLGQYGSDGIVFPDGDPHLDEEKHQLKRIVPEKYKGVCFENLPHYQVYPKFGDRIVCVFTFK